jgi:hypothetical protein
MLTSACRQRFDGLKVQLGLTWPNGLGLTGLVDRSPQLLPGLIPLQSKRDGGLLSDFDGPDNHLKPISTWLDPTGYRKMPTLVSSSGALRAPGDDDEVGPGARVGSGRPLGWGEVSPVLTRAHRDS